MNGFLQQHSKGDLFTALSEPKNNTDLASGLRVSRSTRGRLRRPVRAYGGRGRRSCSWTGNPRGTLEPSDADSSVIEQAMQNLLHLTGTQVRTKCVASRQDWNKRVFNSLQTCVELLTAVVSNCSDCGLFECRLISYTSFILSVRQSPTSFTHQWKLTHYVCVTLSGLKPGP